MTIARLWQSFRTKVVPADAPKVQVDGTKMAFYGGVAAALKAVNAGWSQSDMMDEVGRYVEEVTRPPVDPNTN